MEKVSYDDLLKAGYVITKPNKCYHVFAPGGQSLGITSERHEAKAWAVKHYLGKK